VPCRAVQLIVLVATLWAASVVGVVAQPQRPFGTILAEWSRTIDQASQELGRGEIAPERSARLIERLDQIEDEAAQIQDNARDQLDPLYGQLRALGVVPGEGEAPEPAAIATQRSQLRDTIATFEARVRQTELTITRAQELEDRLKSAVREQALERLLKDFPSPYIPANFLKALPEFLQQLALVAASPLLWWQEFALDNRQKGHLYGTGLILVMTFGIGWLLRHHLLRWFGHDPANGDPTYARRLLAAIAEGLARGLVPALIFGAILYRITSESALIHGLFADVMVALLGVLIFFVLAWALPHAVLAPDLPAWRLTPLSAKNSNKIARGVALLAGVYAIDLFIRLATKSLVSSEVLTSSYVFVSNTIEAALILALLRGKLWQAEPVAGAPGEEPAEEAQKLKRRHIWTAIRLAVGLAAVAAVALAVAGYANLSDFLINRLMASGVIVGVLFLFRGLVRETIGVWLRSDFMRSMLDVRYSARNILKFWFRAFLDVVVFGAGLFLLLSAWGMPIEDMWFWIERALTGLTIGNVTLSIADILVAIAVFVIALVATRMLQRALRDKVLPQTRLDAGVRHSLSAGVWYLGLIIASVLAISVMGLELSNLAIIAGALSVGIGFGLQGVVNNFVSGFILLIERPFKVGDWIVAGTNQGFVKRIQLRSTEIETFQRASIIIPNADLLSSALVNWTHKDRYGRVDVPIAVAYGSDVPLVMTTLERCLRDNNDILDWPTPQVLFRAFGESSLDFEARGFIANIETIYQVQSALLVAIDQAFRDADIEIPFPQRDLHLKGFDGLLAAGKSDGEA
jgi:small-conductance mechanosensitive channel